MLCSVSFSFLLHRMLCSIPFLFLGGGLLCSIPFPCLSGLLFSEAQSAFALAHSVSAFTLLCWGHIKKAEIRIGSHGAKPGLSKRWIKRQLRANLLSQNGDGLSNGL
jgi:hypothetical protein